MKRRRILCLSPPLDWNKIYSLYPKPLPPQPPSTSAQGPKSAPPNALFAQVVASAPPSPPPGLRAPSLSPGAQPPAPVLYTPNLPSSLPPQQRSQALSKPNFCLP
ncbi:hypothetical protein AMTR_s00104p00116680 [Amborella trichopoda]|uniref:Uncharacterized protein n=1 Tax=Amborella trichopoda TaxID=13333 RepID=W1NXJ7_AMBTC|nr:hypothetical protein AMTR_s00104p00116680 [Amborella trichopoda]